MSLPHEIRENEIFVFGTNKAGKHGLGAPLTARMKYGAEMGFGFGLKGQSFAIPVKDEDMKLMPLEEIQTYVDLFFKFAEKNFDKRFFITNVGTALAEYSPPQMAAVFKNAPGNCRLPPEWGEIIRGLKTAG